MGLGSELWASSSIDYPIACSHVPYGDQRGNFRAVCGPSFFPSVRTDLRARPFKAARDGRMTLLRMSETTAAADGADSNETRKLCLLFVCSSLAFQLEEEEKRPTDLGVVRNEVGFCITATVKEEEEKREGRFARSFLE